MNVPIKYVNVYLEDRAYGGPEEGGWWYTYGTPARASDLETWLGGKCVEAINPSFRTVNYAQAASHVADMIQEQNDNRRSDIGSVISEGRFIVRVQDHEPRSYPEGQPYYC